MKINTQLIVFGLMFGFMFLHFSSWSNPFFKDLNNYQDYSPKAISHINDKFKIDLLDFNSKTTEFKKQVELLIANKENEEYLLESYTELRESFKKIEFIIEHLDKEAYDKLLNGAPLPRLEKKVADITVLNPHGLQVIDEIMGISQFPNNENLEKLFDEVKMLETNVQKIYTFLSLRKLTDRLFFEAVRKSLIRLATLGVTGFDTPGTLTGITDAESTLRSLNEYLEYYDSELRNVGRIGLLNKTNTIFEKGIKATKKQDFDNFNRLKFIKEVINPAYKAIKEIHLALNYETVDEVSKFMQALNYNSNNIFDKDFLNAFYYVSFKEDSTYASKVELGKLLFYDPILSKNNDMACATCHKPDKAFTDGEILSISNKGEPLKRNAMTLNYSVYATKYFHDLRVNRLEDQFEHVVVNEDEFDSSYSEILEKVKSSPTYMSMFKIAFPNTELIKFNDIDYALAAYVMKLNTFDSPVDKYFQGRIQKLPKAVERGFNLFTGKAACATCHFTPLFSGNLPPLFVESEAEVLGVPDKNVEPWVLDDDKGRINNGVNQDIAKFYVGAFKTPTIRNIELTAPYMHNGVFNTLDEVMDFYNKGGGAGNGMDLEHQTLSSDPLNLSEEEVADIIAFMKALTDTEKFCKPEDLPRDFSENSINERTF